MRVAIVLAVLLAAGAATANPYLIELLVDFDPPNYISYIEPAPYTTVNAYVVAELWAPEPVWSISFDLNVWEGTTAPPGSFVPMMPMYDVQIVENGITVVNPDCWDTWPVTLGYLSLFYLGNPGLVEIVPHVDNGHSYITCGDPGEVIDYCYVLHGGIGMQPYETTYCGSPVENITWGAVKALYR